MKKKSHERSILYYFIYFKKMEFCIIFVFQKSLAASRFKITRALHRAFCGEAPRFCSRFVKSNEDKAVPWKFAKFPRIFRINFQTYEIKYYVPMLVLSVVIVTLVSEMLLSYVTEHMHYIDSRIRNIACYSQVFIHMYI